MRDVYFDFVDGDSFAGLFGQQLEDEVFKARADLRPFE
jgi:hypothetical protein